MAHGLQVQLRQIGETLTIKSAISEDQEDKLDELAKLIVDEVGEE